jgi:transcriptional regulator with XRE-family HTH domain
MGRWFRTRLRDAREAAGMSQRELAEHLDVAQSAISYWESGTVEPREEARERVDAFITRWDGAGDKGKDGTATPQRDASVRAAQGGDSSGDEEYSEDAQESEGSFSTWLAEARGKAGLTRQQLAKKADVSPQTIYLIETGKIASPRESTVKTLTEALGRDPSKVVQEQIAAAGKIEGVGEFRDFDPHDDADVPTVPGVYVFYDVSDRPIYVGKGKNIRTRVKDHADKFWFKLPIVQTAAYVEIRDPELRDQVETLLIKFLKKNAIINKYKLHRGEEDGD